jgi:protein-tyrosine phosphatase
VPVNYVKAANILTYLNGATTFLHTMLQQQQQQQQGSVLVHCEQGMS